MSEPTWLDQYRGTILGVAEQFLEGDLSAREAAARVCSDAVLYLGQAEQPAPELTDLLAPFARALWDPPGTSGPALREAAEKLLTAPIEVWPA